MLDARAFVGTSRFRVLHRIGEGGAGVVFEALDTEQDARVALKVLHSLHPDALIRFKHEFRAMRDLRHPNLVSLGELFQDAGHWFFTMEFVQGVDFLRWVEVDRQPLEDFPTPLVGIATGGSPATASPLVGTLGTSLRFDEQRLRNALVQLARGLGALHASGKVHRDIKPSNVLVQPDGRVAILDFGLVVDIGSPEHVITQVTQIVGTPAFMAPEQAAGEAIQPAADWYAVGVMLYRALTGRLPYLGTGAGLLRAKMAAGARPPSALVAGVPRDLDALCADLLRRDPDARPSGNDILRRLGSDGALTVDEPPRATAQGAPFVGRLSELAELRSAFDETRANRAVVVFVTGESGVGKSALMRHFADQVAKEKGAVVLSGSCHEREAVPYRGIDGVIDSLARYMASLPEAEAAALVPLQASLLPQVFPVLRRVAPIAGAPRSLREVSDLRSLRLEVFAALRELLMRLAQRHPVLLLLDDWQWIDVDSLALLREVLRSPEPPPILLLASARPSDSGESLVAEIGLLPSSTRRLPLTGLSDSDAQRLASLLLVDSTAEERAGLIARESRGHPFFIGELARQAGSRDATVPTLQEAIWSRVAKLDEPARRILELVAVARAPIAEQVAAEATALDFGEFIREATALRTQNLLRMSGTGRGDVVEAYHDRIVAAVLAHLDGDALRTRHEQIALAMEASGDPEALAMHWRGAGRPERAATHAVAAADQAITTLAFDRAARLYRLALELRAHEGEATVRTRLAEALANAGRGAEASAEYLAAAALAPTEAVDLRIRAGQELLMTGHVDEGLEVLSTVPPEIGIRLPRGPASAIASLLFRRAQIRLRGLSFVERSEAEVPASELRRIDIYHSLARGFSVDAIYGSHVQARHLLVALRAGEPHRVARALVYEATYSATGGHWNSRRTERVLNLAKGLSDRLGNASLSGLEGMIRAFALFLEGRWRESLEIGERADRLICEQGTGMPSEMDGRQLDARNRYYLGDIAELSRRLPVIRQHASEIGNQNAIAQMSMGTMTIDSLARDEPEIARMASDAAMATWSQRGTHVPHFAHLVGCVHIDLYRGQGRAAYECVQERGPTMKRGGLTRVQVLRVNLLDLRARAALSAAADGGDSARLIAEADRCGRRLFREEVPWAQATAKLVQAGVAAARGKAEAAVVLLEDATRRFEQEGMHLHAACARRRLGAMIGGDSGRALVDEANAWMERQSIRDAGKITEMLAPGWKR